MALYCDAPEILKVSGRALLAPLIPNTLRLLDAGMWMFPAMESG